MAEHDNNTGNVLKEYIWIDDMPVAVIDSSTGVAQTYYVHTGAVNEPLAMTNASKAIVWNAYVEPFGTATVFGTPSANVDLRLPGQWLEAETGNLNQNWYREYDPSLGRYVEADPLGLAAGQDVYSYVDGDPLSWIDPTGLSGVLTVYARYGPGGSSGMGLPGHSWLSYSPDGNDPHTTTYGTWSDGSRSSGIYTNREIGLDSDASRTSHLTDAQEGRLYDEIWRYRNLGHGGWTPFTPCSTFTADAWRSATGENLNPYGPLSNPAQMVNSIVRANSGRAKGVLGQSAWGPTIH